LNQLAVIKYLIIRE